MEESLADDADPSVLDKVEGKTALELVEALAGDGIVDVEASVDMDVNRDEQSDMTDSVNLEIPFVSQGDNCSTV